MRILLAGIVVFFMLVERAEAGAIGGYPILEAIQAKGGSLAKETGKWMGRWKGTDLEQPGFDFKELSGSTSINLKVRRLDPADKKGYKAHGTYVTTNSAANPYLEIAYFNLAAVVGRDSMFRPAVPYELGPRAAQSFKELIEATPIRGTYRQKNKERILAAIATGAPLRGCLKANKIDGDASYDAIANVRAGVNGEPRFDHAIIRALQATNPKPDKGIDLELMKGYKGNFLQLVREYSVLMTFDAIFQQWDRYSGGNVVVVRDESGSAHFYATDNGGAEIGRTTSWVTRNLDYFSRYDREVIARLRELLSFLENPATGFLGYADVRRFVVDLGLYGGMAPDLYAERLSRNLRMVLDRVGENERKHGANAFLD